MGPGSPEFQGRRSQVPAGGRGPSPLGSRSLPVRRVLPTLGWTRGGPLVPAEQLELHPPTRTAPARRGQVEEGAAALPADWQLTGRLRAWPSRDSRQAALAQMACAGKRHTQGRAAGPGGTPGTRLWGGPPARRCQPRTHTGPTSGGLLPGLLLRAGGSPAGARELHAGGHGAPGEMEEQGWGPTANAEAVATLRTGRARGPPYSPGSGRSQGGRARSRADLGLEVGPSGGRAADGLLCPSCSLACGGIGGTGSPAAPPTEQAGAQAARRPTSAHGHAPPLCHSALPVPHTDESKGSG